MCVNSVQLALGYVLQKQVAVRAELEIMNALFAQNTECCTAASLLSVRCALWPEIAAHKPKHEQRYADQAYQAAPAQPQELSRTHQLCQPLFMPCPSPAGPPPVLLSPAAPAGAPVHRVL